MITSIIHDQDILDGQMSEFKAQLNESAVPNNGGPHNHYKDMFNAIYLHDRWYFQLQDNHSVEHWKPEFILSILDDSLINSFVLYRHSQPNHF